MPQSPKPAGPLNGWFLLYLMAMALLVGTILITPLLALHGPKDAAAFLYNTYVPTCHQWIYRSDCIFYDGQNHWIGDCIQKGENPITATEFTNASKQWDGPFRYSRDQIGLNRAERVEYAPVAKANPDSNRIGFAQADSAPSAARRVIGYKFANDTRNIGIYSFMLLSGLALAYARPRIPLPHWAWLLASMLPVGIDGTGQMLGYWESTNLVRFASGAIMGVGMSVFIYSMLRGWKSGKKKTEAGASKAPS